ncbi:aminoglycoside phosphotransferase family protein [Brachybacterium sp. EF45031]|uniref:phosphotransferase family protein n=1 Tax=Brachybacterium sillae TaxID=2810536 RepID=UPI00217D30D1|nr:aminoglycoside phosphotransferase family protein [Brachybacterium sillae]MCS6711915.1 aminoglycoside phosphotransferase family protein [Brachybacterium sillae]
MTAPSSETPCSAAPSRHPSPDAPPPTSPAMGERILATWAEGSLLCAPPDDPRAEVRLLGVGESSAAWELRPREQQTLIVRVPRDPAAPAAPRSAEAAALTQLRHVGDIVPVAVAVHDDPATSPLGVPVLVTTAQPGRILPPARWTPEHLRAHARTLARLHTVAMPGRGTLRLGPDPLADVTPGPLPLLPEARAALEGQCRRAPEVITREGLAPLVDAALAVVERVDELAGPCAEFVVAHGDLCATNVVWESDAEAGALGARPRFIDLEWARADDPARDLEILAGPIHVDPWYLPGDKQTWRLLVEEYVRAGAQARGAQTPHPSDLAERCEELLLRMRGWEAYERTSMLLHVATRASSDPMHARLLPTLREAVTARLALHPADRSH